jgi:hypothetical protein
MWKLSKVDDDEEVAVFQRYSTSEQLEKIGKYC